MGRRHVTAIGRYQKWRKKAVEKRPGISRGVFVVLMGPFLSIQQSLDALDFGFFMRRPTSVHFNIPSQNLFVGLQVVDMNTDSILCHAHRISELFVFAAEDRKFVVNKSADSCKNLKNDIAKSSDFGIIRLYLSGLCKILRYKDFADTGESMMKKKFTVILLILVLFVLSISLVFFVSFNSHIRDFGDAVIGSADTWTFIYTK